jgi:fluoroacetyl-CoA thioesterase
MKHRKKSTRDPKSKTKSSPKRSAVAPKKSPALPQRDFGPRPKIGSEATYEAVVPHEWTIQNIDPNLPPVLSTPRMIQMMEHASTVAVRAQLEPGTISVGTRIEVDHLKAVPNGTKVQAHARLTGFQGRFLVFEVEARAAKIVIGRGKVFRAIVHSTNHGEKAKTRVTQETGSPSK